MVLQVDMSGLFQNATLPVLQRTSGFSGEVVSDYSSGPAFNVYDDVIHAPEKPGPRVFISSLCCRIFSTFSCSGLPSIAVHDPHGHIVSFPSDSSLCTGLPYLQGASSQRLCASLTVRARVCTA